MARKEEIDNASYEYTGEYTNSDFHFGAEWADEHPREEHIAAYLGKKGWPLSSQGIPTYEQANKMMLEYYEYKKKQWIDEACKYIKEYAPIDYDCDGFVEEFRKAMEVKNV